MGTEEGGVITLGYGMVLECKKCKFKNSFFLGVGMLFPSDYEKIVEDIYRGVYGEEYKRFFEENAGAAVKAEQSMYQCPACNHLIQDYDMSLYVKEKGEPPKNNYCAYWCDDDHEYKFVRNYIHKCPKCTKRMHKVTDFENNAVPCPKCGDKMVIENGLHWD